MSKNWVFLSEFIPYNYRVCVEVKQFDISIDIRMYKV